jgi:N-acetylglucosamine kinase-like BadF-type ATPase
MRWVLGFDGGGTKTECVLMDEEKSVVALGRSAGSNPVRVGTEQAVDSIKQAAESAILESRIDRSSIAALCAGIAGTGQAEMAESMRAGLAKLFPEAALKICTDLDIALAAVGEGPAMVLNAGTGSIAMGRDAKGRQSRAGGLGVHSGDEGSAADVGKKAALAAKLHYQQTSEETPLGKQLLRQLGHASWKEFRENNFDVFPRLFPVVANAADAGDAAARKLLSGAADDLASLVKQVVNDLSLCDQPFRLAKMGGMIGRCAFFDRELDLRIRAAAPNAEIGLLPVSPAHAAALLALQLIFEPGTAKNSHG